MAPDRTHIHHIFIRAGFTKTRTLYSVLFLQSIFVVLGVVICLAGILDGVGFVCTLFFIGFYQLFLKKSWKFIRWSRRLVGAK